MFPQLTAEQQARVVEEALGFVQASSAPTASEPVPVGSTGLNV